nr:hypothetical protein [Photobacterium damselae]
MAKQRKSYLSIFGLIMAFLLPIALAKVMLEKNGIKAGSPTRALWLPNQ